MGACTVCNDPAITRIVYKDGKIMAFCPLHIGMAIQLCACGNVAKVDAADADPRCAACT